MLRGHSRGMRFFWFPEETIPLNFSLQPSAYSPVLLPCINVLTEQFKIRYDPPIIDNLTKETDNPIKGIPMETIEDRIIDLVDVISEPDPVRPSEPRPAPDAPTIKVSSTINETAELETLVRKEVERLIKSTVNENIQKMIKEVLIQEVEKAVAREMETLKRT